MGRPQQDETLWDADKEEKVARRRSLACALLPGHPGYQGTGRAGGEKKKIDGEDAAKGDAAGC